MFLKKANPCRFLFSPLSQLIFQESKITEKLSRATTEKWEWTTEKSEKIKTKKSRKILTKLKIKDYSWKCRVKPSEWRFKRSSNNSEFVLVISVVDFWLFQYLRRLIFTVYFLWFRNILIFYFIFSESLSTLTKGVPSQNDSRLVWLVPRPWRTNTLSRY